VVVDVEAHYLDAGFVEMLRPRSEPPLGWSSSRGSPRFTSENTGTPAGTTSR
jgi:hypothetical protein